MPDTWKALYDVPIDDTDKWKAVEDVSLDALGPQSAAPRFPPVGASAPAPKPVKAPASYQIQADEPSTPKPVGPPMISTRRILRQKPALPESMQPTAIEKAADLIEGVPVVGPLLTAPVRLSGITPTPPQPAQTYEGERGQSLDVGANWRPSGEMGNAADDVRSVRDNMLRQPFGMGEAIEKADVPWYAGGDLTKGALKAASGLVDSPEALLTLSAIPAAFGAAKGGKEFAPISMTRTPNGVSVANAGHQALDIGGHLLAEGVSKAAIPMTMALAPRAAVTAAELEFAKGGIESGLEAARDPNKSFLEKAGEIGAQGAFAGGMIAGAGRTMRPEIARVESAVTDVARDRTAKAQGLPFAPPEPTDIQRTWAQFRQLDPGERWQDILSTLPDNDLKAAALGEENPFRKGLAAQEIKRRERLNVWRPTAEAPEQPLNRATRRETVAVPEPDLQMVADELGLGAFEDLTPDVQAQVRGLRDEAAGLSRGPSVKAKPEEKAHEFASTQANLPVDAADAVKRESLKIPDDVLAEDGREANPHVTVKFGLHEDSPEAIQKVTNILSEVGPIRLRLGETSIFPAKESGGADVVKVDVDSPDLHRINKLIADAVPNTDTHPVYKPHVTLAYVKAGEGKRFAGNNALAGREIVLDRIAFSDKNRNQVEIPLGKSTPAPLEMPPSAEYRDMRAGVQSGLRNMEPSRLDRAADEARARLKSAFRGETLSANPVGLIGDFAIIGAQKLVHGAKDFNAWAREMVAEYGPAIQQHLKAIYDQSVQWIAEHAPERRQASPRRMATQKGAMPVYRDPMPERQRAAEPPIAESAEPIRTEEPRRLTISPNADESSIKIIEKSGLGEASQMRMVDAVDAYLKRNPERKVMSDEEYKDLARDVDPQLIWAIDPKRLTPGNMPPREVLEATRGVLSTVQTELDKLTKELEGPVLEADRPTKEAELTRLESDQQHLMDILFPVRSEHGRNLRLWGQMALDNLDPVAWIARARRMAGLPGGVALPGKVEGEITKALGDNRIAEADAIQQVTAIDRGKQKMKDGAEKPKPEKPVVELSREERVEQARKQTIKRLQAELNGKRITDTLTPEERALIADDPTVKQLREQVHELRAKNKPIKTADEMVAAEIERERKRLSKVLEGEPVTARVDKLTPEQRKLVDADTGLQSLRARIQERRAQDRLKKQKTPEEKAVESEVKRVDTLTAKEDGTYQPKVITKAELTPEQRARVNHDPRVLAARKRLFEAMKKSQQQSKLDVISMVRRAGLLTAPKTWLRNIGGNTAFAVSEEVSRIPASILDAGLSVVSGNGRTVQGMSLNAMRKATYEAATRGTQEFMDVMRDGATADQLAQFDFRREMNSGSKVLDTYVNTVMRFMSAQDRVFKRYAFERSLQEQMKLAGVGKPTEAMNAQAVSDAEFATFNNRNKIAKSFSQWKAGMGDGGRFAVDMIVPFSQTPSNVILRGLDYTPIGAVGRMVGAAWKAEGGLTPELQRSISMAFGRGAVGSALLLTGYLLAKKNLATGNRPQNPAEARADETARRQWGAVKMGDHWRQLTAISPVGALITTGAAMYEAQNLRVTGEDEEEKRKKRIGHAGMAIVKTVEDMPMLQGVQMVDSWRKDPFGSGERVAGRMAGSFVPTIAADLAAAADPVRRDAKGFWAQVAARTPARLMLPEKVDALGKPIEQNRFAAIDPTLGQRAAEDSDPLLKAIVDEQMTFGVPPKKAGESEESYRFRLKVLGAAREFVMRSAMASDQFRGAQSWRNGSDERREILGDATRQAASGINKALGKDYKEQSAEEQMRRLREVADGLKVQ